MSTVQQPGIVGTINNIEMQTMNYAPAVMAGVQAAELSSATGAAKKQAVVNGIIAGSQTVQQSPGVSPTVSAIAGLVDLFVSIFNSLGVFSHKS